MSKDHPYREAYLSPNCDPRIPEHVFEMAEEHMLGEEVVQELLHYECEKTEDLQEIIEMFNEGYKKMIERIGIKPFSISSDRIHIIETAALLRHTFEVMGTVDGEPGGFAHDGHMYFRDDTDSTAFIARFSHEFMHLVSKAKKVVEVFINEDPDEPPYGTKFRILRSGLHQVSDRADGVFQYGAGLNEAITELLALELRRYSMFPADIPREMADRLRRHPTTYRAEVEVLKGVFKKYLNLDLDKLENVEELLKMYVTGDSDLLKRLAAAFRERGPRNGLKILFSMEASMESAKSVSELLELQP